MLRQGSPRCLAFGRTTSGAVAVVLCATVAPAAFSTPSIACVPAATVTAVPEQAMVTSFRAATGVSGQVRRDATGIFSLRTVSILAVGGALAGISSRYEEPNRAARTLGQPGLEEGCDFGNLYGDAATLGGGAIGMWAAGRWFKSDNLAGAGGELARAIVYSAAITLPLKAGVGRTRPDGGSYSFPSGHTTLAFAAAPILARHFGGRLGALSYLAAATTGMGRLQERKHYLSDVVFGAAVGLSIGMAVSDGSARAIAPALVIRDTGVGVAVRF